MECFVWVLMDIPSRSKKDISVEGDFNCAAISLQASQEDSFGMLPNDHPYEVLVMNVAFLCLYLKCLPEPKVKRFIRLIALTKKSQINQV